MCTLLFIYLFFFMACNAKILTKKIKIKIIPAIPVSAKSQICVVSDLESFQQISLLNILLPFTLFKSQPLPRVLAAHGTRHKAAADFKSVL